MTRPDRVVRTSRADESTSLRFRTGTPTDKAAFWGAPSPAGLSPDEKIAYERFQFVYQEWISYGFQLGLRPQTMYALADSPVGLAACFLDHDHRS